MEGVRLGKEELVRTYGVSQRLAVRVGALLAKGFEVSGTLLEMRGPAPRSRNCCCTRRCWRWRTCPPASGGPRWRDGRRWR